MTVQAASLLVALTADECSLLAGVPHQLFCIWLPAPSDDELRCVMRLMMAAGDPPGCSCLHRQQLLP